MPSRSDYELDSKIHVRKQMQPGGTRAGFPDNSSQYNSSRTIRR